MGKKFTVQIWVIPVNKFCPWILQAWSFGFWKQLGDSIIGISIFWGQISILWLMTTDNKISSVPSSLLPDFGSRGTPRPGRGSWRSQKGFCSGAHKEMFKSWQRALIQAGLDWYLSTCYFPLFPWSRREILDWYDAWWQIFFHITVQDFFHAVG